jgi:signal transduction histidine kinase
MKILQAILSPSLVRRVSVTLLPTSILIWVVLLAFYYWQETGKIATSERQRERAEIVLSVLSKIDVPEQARNMVASYSTLSNAAYRRMGISEKFLLQLEDRRGQQFFISPEAGNAILKGVNSAVVENVINGNRYRVYRSESGRWAVLLGEPITPQRGLLASLSNDLGVSVLISFPFVLLAVWLAVRRGLRPLQILSKTIAERGADDLTPLGLDTKYAELRPLTSALDRLLSQLRMKVAREHHFVQDAAHELRTPMAVISAQAHVMAMANDVEQRREASQHLTDAIARASHLIEQLLDLARIDATSTTLPITFDVAQLLRQELVNLAPIAMARNIELSLEAPDELTCNLVQHAFLSIVQNLLTNAVRYGHDGGRVAVEILVIEGILTLSVADDGPGIAEAERSLVFERFYRVAGTDISGSGLGLAIVTQAVARLRGTVSLTSGLNGRGCCFTVALPLL